MPEELGFSHLSQLDRDLLLCEFRGVGLAQLPAVLETGIDVSPSDSAIFVDGIDKAWEYGGFPKVILALRWDCLERTFREISADADPSEIERVTREYPTVVQSIDGGQLWCSRLHEKDPRLGSPYEVTYGRWVPGDPVDALHGVLIFAFPDQMPELEATLEGTGWDLRAPDAQ